VLVAAASFSRACVLPTTGLVGCGDKISPSLSLLSTLPPSCPDAESPDGRRPWSGRDWGRPAIDRRALAVLVGALPVREMVEEVETCLAVRLEDMAGGPMEVRAPGAEGRVVLEPVEGARVWDGVPVREAEVLGGPLIILVGDLVGDRAMLEGRVLGMGLGLGALMLLLLAAVGSAVAAALLAAGLKLLGLAGFLAAAGFAAGAWATMVAIMGLTNMP
jgi:hypothetical protein